MGNGELIPIATGYRELGLSPIPVQTDKKPCAAVLPRNDEGHAEWGHLQENIATLDQIGHYWKNGVAHIGVVCGRVSGNLEVLDFDIPKQPDDTRTEADIKQFKTIAKEFKEKCEHYGYSELWESLTKIQTPSGGFHVIYRCECPVDGNKKLASTNERRPRTLIETRGEGGYIATAPTLGYKFWKGNFDDIKTISEDDREFFLTLARSLDRSPAEKIRPTDRCGVTVKRPGDDYNLKVKCDEPLSEAGWQFSHENDRWREYVRPGKSRKLGISGGVTKDGRLFYCHTSNGFPFKERTAYDAFAVYTYLHHAPGGMPDFSEAATALKAKGYGESSIDRQTREERDANIRAYETRPAPASNIQTIDEFEEELPIWLWPGYIRKQQLNLVEGKGSVGKTTFLLSIAAAGSIGRLPFGEECEPFSTLIFARQDSPGEIRAKMRQITGGHFDPKRIFIRTGAMCLDPMGMSELHDSMLEHKVSYVPFDPMKTYFPSSIQTEFANIQQNKFFDELRAIVQNVDAAPMLTRHFARFTNGRDLTDMGAGGEEWRNSARAQLVFLPHPHNAGETGVFSARGSLNAKPGPPFGYALLRNGEIGWISPEHFELEVYAEAYPAVAEHYGIQTEDTTPKSKRGRPSNRRADAIAWLSERLASGSAFQTTLIQEGTNHGFGSSTIRDALSSGVFDKVSDAPITWRRG